MRERRYFFLHVMKTAGTTFTMQLREQFPAASIYPSRGFDWESPSDVEPYMNLQRVLGLSPERRAEVRVYTGHFPHMVCDMIATDLRKLTLLRDPVERTVSVLKQFKRLDERYRELALEEIYDDESVFRRYIENHQTKVFCLTPDDKARSILRPVTVDDERYELAKRNLASVDVVGLTERYGEFLDELRARFGWWPDGVADRARANVSEEAWDVAPGFRERIADDNRYDVAFYQYAQALLARRATASPGPSHGP